MPRVKRGVMHSKRRRNILKKTKGYTAGRKNLIKLAKTSAMKAGAEAYRGRREKKRTFRQLWEARLNAAVREYGWTYSKFIGALKKANSQLDRKVLSQLAATEPEIFKKIVDAVRK